MDTGARMRYDSGVADPHDTPSAGGAGAQGAGKQPDAAALPRDARAMLAMARAFLERKGVESARLEAELLVAHALKLDRLRLFLDLERPVVPAEIDAARDLLVRRGKREPVHYILGVREFYGRPFAVGRGTLVPRPETEHIVDRVRELAKERAAQGAPPLSSALDMGTGSGCLATTLALELASLSIVGVDASAEALDWARRNALALAPGPLELARLRFEHGDMHAALCAGGPYDLVVSNPPYIDPDHRASLAPEVRDWEPEAALYGPRGDPDQHVRRILEAAPGRLAAGGVLLVELGHDQAPRVRELCRRLGLVPRFHKDLGGHERVVEVVAGS